MLTFKNRLEASLMLAERLQEYKNENGLVLAIPRGGVPIGYIISKELKFPLDIILSKKIGHPFQKEYAIGAVSIEDFIIDAPANVKPEYIESEIQNIRNILKERYKALRGNHKPEPVKDKTVILTDDGVATGKTMLVAIRMIRKLEAKKIIVATPVIAPEAESLLKKEADRVVAIMIPPDFRGVGQFYDDFHQIPDEEVIELLR